MAAHIKPGLQCGFQHGFFVTNGMSWGVDLGLVMLIWVELDGKKWGQKNRPSKMYKD
jgi:hypothetical protein